VAVEWMPTWERPIRIPERVVMRPAEPAAALAGERGTWVLPFELAEDVDAGTALKLQLSGGRNNKADLIGNWAEDPAGAGLITVEDGTGSALACSPGVNLRNWVITVGERGLEKGDVVRVMLREVEATRVRFLSKFFVLHREPGESGKETKAPAGNYWTDANHHVVVGACMMHVLGNEIEHLRAYAPSQANPGEEIAVLVRPEDAWGNLSCQRPGKLRVFCDGQVLASRTEAVGDSTCVRVKVTPTRKGVHRLVVKDEGRGLEAVTNPVVCGKTSEKKQVLWGVIHGHTEMSDGVGTQNYYFHQIRNEAGLNFSATSDHDSAWEHYDRLWTMTCETVKRWNEPGAFTVFLGYEWAKWRKWGDGDRNVIYLEDDRPIYRSDDGHYPAPSDLFRALKNEKAIVIPHHTGHAGNWCDWKDHDVTCERLVELYQVRGSFETSGERGNPTPEHSDSPRVEGYVQNALATGWRVGFTGGGDDHSGHAGTDYVNPVAKEPYKAGLMSVEATGCTREEIWDALWNRRVVATTGPRMILTYRLNGKSMGSELSARDDTGLAGSRRIEIEFHGTADVERIDIIRNNELVKRFAGNEVDCTVGWEDTQPLEAVLMGPAKFSANRFCFYYVRVVQKDGEAAWASPTWVEK